MIGSRMSALLLLVGALAACTGQPAGGEPSRGTSAPTQEQSVLTDGTGAAPSVRPPSPDRTADANPTVEQNTNPPQSTGKIERPARGEDDTRSGRGVPPARGPGAGEGTDLLAFGTEPFWSVRPTTGALLWSTPENIEGTRLPATREPTLRGYRWAGREAGRSYSLDILPGACSDGMSDRRHDYSARWTIDGRMLEGCARPVTADDR